MRVISKRCVVWAIGLLLVGAIIHVYGPSWVTSLYLAGGASREQAVGLIDIVLTLVRWGAFPMAAALVGAVIVLENVNRKDGA